MADTNVTAGSVEKPADVGLSPSGVHKRWMLEIKLAEKARKEWKKDVIKALDIYTGKERKASSFNILWANTETLRPAIYNSLPRPDVRKRFDDSPDKVAVEASEILERALIYSMDAYGADSVFRMSALDLVLAGRGVARVRYIPTISETEETAADEANEGLQREEVVGEQCVCEHVQWDDFLYGPGKTWNEVPWVGFKHRMTRLQLEDKFPELGAKVPMDSADDDDVKKVDDQSVANTFKTAEVYEVWDKDTRKVIFLAPGYSESVLIEIDDPLSLLGFFPVPEPVFAIEKTDSLIPTTLYSLYKDQVELLNTISTRIEVITKALKLRGVYDATLAEIGNLSAATDNQMIPLSSASLLADKGGLEKAIWFMPVEQAAKILVILEGQREACKQVIYEITGISDIVRGASNARETATAQQIKAQFGTIRLQRMQREFQRYARDIVRMMAEVIAERFSPESLMMISGKRLPTMAEVQAEAMKAKMAWEQQAALAQQQGQPVPPAPQLPQVVTVEDVMGVLRSDLQRQYRVDIETDSTIQAMEGADQQAISNLMSGIGAFVQAVGPAIQVGVIPAQAAKAILSSIVRKYKLGREVEDALGEASDAMPPQVQQAMQQVQEAHQQVQEQAAQVEQGKKNLAAESKIAKLENEKQRMAIDHAAEIHKVRTEQANEQTLSAVRRMLDEHTQQIGSLLMPRQPMM